MKQSIVNKLGNLKMKKEQRSRNGHIANMGGHGFGLGTRKSGDEELRDRWQRPGGISLEPGLACFCLCLAQNYRAAGMDGWMGIHACMHAFELEGEKKKQVVMLV